MEVVVEIQKMQEITVEAKTEEEAIRKANKQFDGFETEKSFMDSEILKIYN